MATKSKCEGEAPTVRLEDNLGTVSLIHIYAPLQPFEKWKDAVSCQGMRTEICEAHGSTSRRTCFALNTWMPVQIGFS